MKFVIIEDELPAYKHLSAHLKTIDATAFIYPQLPSVAEAVMFLNEQKSYDLVFADIHLQDGDSFELLHNYPVKAPIVFTTAFDNYMTNAFELNSIDYLLKPVDLFKLKKTLEKYEEFKSYFLSKKPTSLIGARERIIVKRGNDFQLLPVADIVYLFTENKLVFAVDKEKRKYLCNETNLTELVAHLDEATFYRANRKYVVHMKHLEKFHSDERSRIVIIMAISPEEPIVVSQENAAGFRRWVGQE
ncbi:MAG: LytTR family DNA-binding domain-containing protein [Bacteroidota bacterium]